MRIGSSNLLVFHSVSGDTEQQDQNFIIKSEFFFSHGDIHTEQWDDNCITCMQMLLVFRLRGHCMFKIAFTLLFILHNGIHPIHCGPQGQDQNCIIGCLVFSLRGVRDRRHRIRTSSSAACVSISGDTERLGQNVFKYCGFVFFSLCMVTFMLSKRMNILSQIVLVFSLCMVAFPMSDQQNQHFIIVVFQSLIHSE